MQKNEKRRDSKGRILREGESQRSDGRYVYKIIDDLKKPQFFYSWKLEPTDKTPYGKKDGKALREIEKEILRDQLNGVSSRGGDMTVLDLVQRYVRIKTNGVRATTARGYQTVLNLLEREAFASFRIDKVKTTDAKLFLIKLQKEDGRSYSSIHTIRGVLRPAFELAVDDDLIRKNPFKFELAEVIIDDSVTREAITREQERRFLDFVKNDKHYSRYYEGIFILFKTGIRISEFTGLTIDDIDMHERTINIDKQLQRDSSGRRYIEATKTGAGTRVLPMTDDVYEAFKTIIANRKPQKIEPIIDGHKGFLYLDQNGQPLVALHWQHYFANIVNKFNRIYREQLPTITPHVCRHTYCSNMARSRMNPKVLQQLMGHSDISITLNTYTHLGLQDARDELKRLEQEQQKKPNESAQKLYKFG